MGMIACYQMIEDSVISELKKRMKMSYLKM